MRVRTMAALAAGVIAWSAAVGGAFQNGAWSRVAGSWEGEGTQSDQPGEWTIAATLAPAEKGAVVGTIVYPTLACGGDLVLREADARRVEVRERITFGDCVHGGVVTLTPQADGTLRYDWRGVGTDMTAAGTLRRAVR
jgi:hypothetical protein